MTTMTGSDPNFYDMLQPMRSHSILSAFYMDHRKARKSTNLVKDLPSHTENGYFAYMGSKKLTESCMRKIERNNSPHPKQKESPLSYQSSNPLNYLKVKIAYLPTKIRSVGPPRNSPSSMLNKPLIHQKGSVLLAFTRENARKKVIRISKGWPVLIL